MKVLIYILIFTYVAGNDEQDLPLLNTGGIRLENLTDSSVVLTWTLTEWEDNDVFNTTEELRLVVNMETGGQPPIYMTPKFNNQECSISISRCRLNFLTHDTKYKVIISIDDTKKSILLGYAIIEFKTHPIYDPDRLQKKILLYVILPSIVGLFIIATTILLICAKRCGCLCWSKQGKTQISGTEGSQNNAHAGGEEETTMCDHYDQPCVADLHRHESGRYLPVISEQHQPATHHHRQFQTKRQSSKDSSSSSQQQTSLPLDSIIAQQQQRQNQCPPPHHKQWSAGRPIYQCEPSLDNDGYLQVVDYEDTKRFRNGLNVL